MTIAKEIGANNMKNDSWRYPFETFGDNAFDSNNDGKLTGMETLIRDAHLDDVKREQEENKEKNATFTGDNLDGCLTVIAMGIFVLWIMKMIS